MLSKNIERRYIFYSRKNKNLQLPTHFFQCETAAERSPWSWASKMHLEAQCAMPCHAVCTFHRARCASHQETVNVRFLDQFGASNSHKNINNIIEPCMKTHKTHMKTHKLLIMSSSHKLSSGWLDDSQRQQDWDWISFPLWRCRRTGSSPVNSQISTAVQRVLTDLSATLTHFSLSFPWLSTPLSTPFSPFYILLLSLSDYSMVIYSDRKSVV